MNWKNVLYLVRVERKSGRLLRGIKPTRYHENSFLANWPYWVAAVIGGVAGLLASVFANAVASSGGVPDLSIAELSLSIFVAMPTLVLIFSLVFTMLQQIQQSGVRASTQVMYWLPVTWQEHTMASLLANLLGFPLAIVSGITSGLIVFAVFNGLILQALVTSLAIFASAFLGSAITEILRILQVRFIGAVYKSSGRAAVWVRFLGSLIFFITFYIIYFYVFTGNFQYVQAIAETQNALWYVPFVWLGNTLFAIFNGLILESAVFLSASALFIAALYFLGVALNMRFGLYEPPAIKVQTSGIYAPKAGFLGKLGFSTVEAALILKDFRAFTRRRELMTIFIIPIVFIILPIMQSASLSTEAPGELPLFFMAMIFLFPSAFMAMSLGNSMIGEEGRAVWRIYASPVSAKNLVKSKLFFIALFSIITLLVTGFIGIIFYQPSIRMAIAAFLESIFLIASLGSISLAIGFKGADFSETRRARMIRQDWALISLVVCAVAGLAVLAPVIPLVLAVFASSFLPGVAVSTVDLAISVAASGVIAAIIASVLYRVNINLAVDLLRKAEA